ncbi:superoxide dismutase family protein [Plesiomonas shigelloides]|uniref:superoxide dismutase family protein n=1 Tax=Plesiomonas shigelloides TaxID=703 RepID=UPI001C49C2F3
MSESKYDTVFTPELKGAPSGLYGLHVHATPSYDSSTKGNKTVLGSAAGGHFTPKNTDKHEYP